MEAFIRNAVVGLRFAAVAIVTCGLAYPLVATGLGRALFPEQATGSAIVIDGQVIGSRLVEQPFVSDRYFYGRPSACGFDPRALAGSNLAASNPDLRARVAASSAEIRGREGVAATDIPPALVAGSGSCIDPDIPPEAAALQVPRVARARALSIDQVEHAVAEHTRGDGPLALGPSRVNVLEVNVSLDGLSPTDAR